MRKAFTLVAVTALLTGSALAAAPASAACTAGVDTCSGTTTVAFAVGDGVLAIVPTAVAPGAALGETAPSSVISGGVATVTVPLGATTVNDTRLSSTGWSASASAGVFTLTTAATTKPTIAAANAKFAVPAAPVAVNATTALPTISNQATTPTGTNGSATLFTASATGINGAAYTPVMTVTIPANTVTGAYTGTVTQSVS